VYFNLALAARVSHFQGEKHSVLARSPRDGAAPEQSAHLILSQHVHNSDAVHICSDQLLYFAI